MKQYSFKSNLNSWSYEIESIEKDIFNDKFFSGILGVSLKNSCFY